MIQPLGKGHDYDTIIGFSAKLRRCKLVFGVGLLALTAYSDD